MKAQPFAARLTQYRQQLQAQLDAALPAAELHPAALHRAMRYACDGGKRLRALLVYACGEVLGIAPERLHPAATAVELMHAYSLVHDDLPAMDNDDLRRGRPSVHRAFDEATAILVGDALQALAFAVLSRAQDIDAQQRIRMVELLAQAAGSRGMVGGQAIDLESEGRALSLAELEDLHIHKTGALIRCCVALACQSQHATTPQQTEALDRYGRAIGLAYQIQDDVLDIESSSDILGKTAGKDEAAFKSTYPSVMGLPAAKRRASELFATARTSLQSFGDQGEPLLHLLNLIEHRDR